MRVYYENMDPFGWGDFDRVEINDDDGRRFWGSDNDDGTTDWYDDKGNLDCSSETPYDDWDDYNE